jgi:alanyl aminopeptidase
MGDKIAHRVYPDYNLEVTELQSSMNVMNSDARPSSMAIRQPVESTDRLMENVGVQYNKGKAVLAMIEQWMGEEPFRQGVVSYLHRHRWGSAEAADFWNALRRASSPEITQALESFIEQPGLPMVRLEPLQGNRLRITQERFANYGVHQPEELTWAIPIVLKVSDGDRIMTKSVFLQDRSQEVTLDTRGQPDWVLPNADQRGYYRWAVPPQMLAALARNATTDLTERERVGFISNLSALLDAGIIHGDDYLFALGEFADDPKPMVVSALLTALNKVEAAFVPAELENAFAHYVRRTLGPAMQRFGVEARPGEPDEVALFRPRLIQWMADKGKDPEVLHYAGELADSYLEDPASIDASLAGVALRLAAVHGDQARFDDYRQRFETAQVPVDRRRFLSAMGSFEDPELQKQALAYVFDGPLRPNELFAIPGVMMDDAGDRDMVFAWFQEHYDDFATRLPPMFMGFMPFMAGGCSAERLEAARVFFADPEHQAPGTETQLAKVTDSVNDCVGLREREGDVVAAWLDDQAASR